MNVLITGGSGFIGMRMIKALQDTHEVISLSRSDLKEQTRAVVLSGAFHRFEDLRQLDKQAIDVVLHLAFTGSGEEECIEINVAGTRRLVRYLLDRGCRKFVLASSIAATGCLSNRFRPLKLPIPDDHPCLAVDAYGLSKALLLHRPDPRRPRLPSDDFTQEEGRKIDDCEETTKANGLEEP